VTLAFVLVIAKGLLGRIFATLSRVNPGFQPDHLLALDISLADRSFGDPGKRIRFARQIRERILALPGVVSAATVYGLPFGSMVKDQLAFTVRGREPAIAGHPNITGYRQASPGSSRAKSNCYPVAPVRGIRCAKSGVTRWLMCFWLTVLYAQ